MATPAPATTRDWGAPGQGTADYVAQRYFGPDAQFSWRDVPRLMMEAVKLGMNPIAYLTSLGVGAGVNAFRNRDGAAGPGEIFNSGFEGGDAEGWSGAGGIPNMPPRGGYTDPATTLGGMSWMGGDPSDPFGYGAMAYGGPEGEAMSGRGIDPYPSSFQGASAAPDPYGYTGSPSGMSSYLFQPAGGGPPIPIIEGPKYTGAPYNPMAFSAWADSGDGSWWEQHNDAPWLGQSGGVPPGPVPAPSSGFQDDPMMSPGGFGRPGRLGRSPSDDFVGGGFARPSGMSGYGYQPTYFYI